MFAAHDLSLETQAQQPSALLQSEWLVYSEREGSVALL